VDALGLVKAVWLSVHLVLNYLLKERTVSCIASLVAGLHCDAVINILVIVVRGVFLQDGKWVVALCMPLVDRPQETDVGRCSRIM
jgi:hypothetical protein